MSVTTREEWLGAANLAASIRLDCKAIAAGCTWTDLSADTAACNLRASRA